MDIGFFIQLSILILVATLLGFLARIFKQPSILAYVLTGIILGPMVLAQVTQSESLALFSQIGVALLLFIVGISLDPRQLRDVGKVSIITGIGQVIFTALFGFFISTAFGFSFISSLYISIALTFSSTIIIVKLLTDKNDLESLYGRISIGFLLIQDFIAIIALVLISGLEPGAEIGSVLLYTILKGAALIALVWAIYKILIKNALSYLSQEQELFFIGAIAWCLSIAVLSIKLGFSLEIGAFLAGLALAGSDLGINITSKIKPLRDFFIAIFFINLGIGMVFDSVLALIWPIILFSLFILIGNPLIVFIIMTVMGYRSRTSFLAGLTVAQISEFSLILVALGLSLNHLSNEVGVLVTTVGIITITASTYLIKYGDKIYEVFSGPLKSFEKKTLRESVPTNKKKKYDILLFGCHRIGYKLIERFKGKRLLVIDFNPEVVKTLKTKKIDALYADANDSEVLDYLTSFKPKFIISTLSQLDNNRIIIDKFKKQSPKTSIIATARNVFDYLELYRGGAHLIIFPEHIASHKLADEILELDLKNLKKLGKEYRQQILEELKKNHLLV